jgi:2-phosphosulfolactate phosphatase
MSSPALVLIGCLRNASAVAARVAERVRELLDGADAGTAPVRVAVVPAGERWGDGSLRVAYEDHVGAGAVIAGLRSALPGIDVSPEAAVAAMAFEHLQPLAGTPSGRELIERGFARDVQIAGEVDASAVVPVLKQGSFTPA